MSELYPEIDVTQNNYYCNLREFRNGDLEIVLKPVRMSTENVIRLSIDDTPFPVSPVMDAADINLSRKTSVRRKGSEEEDQTSSHSKNENQERAVRRARQFVRFYAKNKGFDRLFTLTYRKNEEDREAVKAAFKKFLRLVRSGFTVKTQTDAGESKKIKYRASPDWSYLAVLEKQKRGAYHIHCAVTGWQRIEILRAAWYKALGGNGDETKQNTLGQVDVTNPDKSRWGHTGRQWRVNKLTQYLTKYMAKTFDASTSEKNRYWRAADLDVPPVSRMWVGGHDITSAIQSAISMLQLHTGLHPRFDHWLSPSGDSYWLSGTSLGGNYA